MKFEVNFSENNSNLDIDFNEQKNNIKVEFKNIQYVNEGSGGTSDYNLLENKPSIEGNKLENNKTFEDLGLKELTNQEILDIVNKIFGGNR